MRYILVLWIFQKFVFPATTLQCKDEHNKSVDWFVVYKFPKIKHHQKLLKAGVAYTYMTSDNYSSWIFSNISINATNSIIANTLQGLYSERNYTYILYNDQPPNKKSKTNKGHNKGVIMIDTTGGFWLVHSVPHFPIPDKKYIFPRTGAVYGQSFLCISLHFDNLNKVGIQLQYNEPEIYSENIQSDIKNLIPELAKAAGNTTVNNAPWYHVSNISSEKNFHFMSFAKSKNFKKDLYEDLVAPALETDLLVETWPNGPGRLQSNCSKKFKVNNIQSLYFNSANISFTTTNDHSKWAVSPPSELKNWICIGDINRAEHQKVRGGGTVCLNNKIISNDYRKCIQSVEDCKKR